MIMARASRVRHFWSVREEETVDKCDGRRGIIEPEGSLWVCMRHPTGMSRTGHADSSDLS